MSDHRQNQLRPGERSESIPADPIRSAANSTLATVRALLTRRDRRAQEQAFVVEGPRAIRDALAAGARPRFLLRREGEQHDLLDDLPPTTPVRLVDARLFDRLSDLEAPQGLLAVFPFPESESESESDTDPNGDARAEGAPRLALLVDRVRDPGNLGTLLRAAAGAGVSAVYLTPTTVDPFNPKVVRAGMGAHFRVTLHSIPDVADAAATLRAAYPLRAVTKAAAATAYDRLDWTEAALVIVGAEAEGISPEVAALGTVEIGIPLAAGVESLNSAIAGAIVLFEAARQRRVPSSE